MESQLDRIERRMDAIAGLLAQLLDMLAQDEEQKPQTDLEGNLYDVREGYDGPL